MIHRKLKHNRTASPSTDITEQQKDLIAFPASQSNKTDSEFIPDKATFTKQTREMP